MCVCVCDCVIKCVYYFVSVCVCLCIPILKFAGSLECVWVGVVLHRAEGMTRWNACQCLLIYRAIFFPFPCSEVHDAEDKELLGPDGKRAITYQVRFTHSIHMHT